MYKNFAMLLDKTNKTAYQVAKDTGISTATLSNWKNGNYIPKVDFRYRRMKSVIIHFINFVLQKRY